MKPDLEGALLAAVRKRETMLDLEIAPKILEDIVRKNTRLIMSKLILIIKDSFKEGDYSKEEIFSWLADEVNFYRIQENPDSINLGKDSILETFRAKVKEKSKTISKWITTFSRTSYGKMDPKDLIKLLDNTLYENIVLKKKLAQICDGAKIEEILSKKDMSGIRVFEKPITELSFSLKTFYFLNNADIKTVEKLTTFSSYDLEKMDCFRKTILREIEEVLSQNGLSLKY